MRFATNNPQNISPLSPPKQVPNNIHIESTQNTQLESVRLHIEGMRCASCSANIENTLKKQDGIKEVNIYILNHSGIVQFDPKKCNIDTILAQIEALGFKASVAKKPSFVAAKPTHSLQPYTTQKETLDTKKHTDSKQTLKHKTLLQKTYDYVEYTLLNDKRRLLFSLLLSLLVVYISMLHDMLHLPLPKWLHNPIYNAIAQLLITLCVMHFGRNMYFHGIKALFRLRPNMDSLVSVGSLAGFFYSCFALVAGIIGTHTFHIYFESVCVILSFIMLGKYIEENAKHKAIKHAKDLLQRQSATALKVINSTSLATENTDTLQTKEVACDSLEIDDYIQILPHSFVPIDSMLYSTYASIDESMLSGESMPIKKEKGQSLFAGTLNLETPIIARVTHKLQDSTISKMQKLLQDTLESKAHIAKLADKISLFFVPLVLLLATCSGIFWLIYADLQTAMLYFASTLLISCPCALGLATPMAILFANARANAFGVFFKNAQSLENLTKTDYILFDKTGTLTLRDFRLHSITLTHDNKEIYTEEALLRIATSIETTSNHIIAKAICNAAKDIIPYKQLHATHYVNAGIKSTLLIDSKERTFLIGNARLLQEQANLTIPDNHAKEGAICVHISEIISNEAIWLGSIFLEETLKPQAKEMIQSLQNMGFCCEILSGDNIKNVAHVANILQIPYHAQCLPEDKMHYIESLQNKGHRVIMVGDGINDAIAIAKADISLVMASGSEVSIEHGNIIYFRDDLLGIVQALRLGRATLNNIKQNLGFAFIYNIICIPIAMGICSPFGITLNPMLASLAMSLSSLSVVGNASRLYTFEKQ